MKVIREGKELINFCSNDYLGLATHPKVIEAATVYTQKYGAGATASRLVSGNFSIHEQLEEELKNTFGFDAAMLFNTGFQANTTVIAALADRNSLILADRKIHNSMLQGSILSRAELKRFHHNDYAHLEQQLKSAEGKEYNRIWILTETVFSMDGDRNDLDKLICLSEQYNALLFSDDAHAIGVLGEKGLGLNHGKEGIDISVGTFGKAFGVFGAFIGCSKPMKEYLVNHCPGFIYTTALPPGVVGAISKTLNLVPKMDDQRDELLRNTAYIKAELQALGFNTADSDSQIIPVIIGDEKDTMNLSGWLEEQGIWASAIRPPTVQQGLSRIRITLTAKHTKEQLNRLIRAFKEWGKR
ncbi:MAG: 8-amino-7-oxononanoate synthase [Balneolaceae bacterium]|nr:8-amino-7-oxononanoate synthase [Balneolaceae bacterium]